MRHKKTKSHAALLLIDFINLFDFDDAQKLGPPAVRAARSTAKLKARARAARVPCIYANDNFGRWTSDFAELTATCLHRKGPAGEIARLLQPEDGDLSVLKPRHSAFYGTPLDFLLEELGVKKVVLTGLTADICVFASAQDAYVRQYEVWIPSDCVAAVQGSFKRESLQHMARTLKADVRAARSLRTLPWQAVRSVTAFMLRLCRCLRRSARHAMRRQVARPGPAVASLQAAHAAGFCTAQIIGRGSCPGGQAGNRSVRGRTKHLGLRRRV